MRAAVGVHVGTMNGIDPYRDMLSSPSATPEQSAGSVKQLPIAIVRSMRLRCAQTSGPCASVVLGAMNCTSELVTYVVTVAMLAPYFMPILRTSLVTVAINDGSQVEHKQSRWKSRV